MRGWGNTKGGQNEGRQLMAQAAKLGLWQVGNASFWSHLLL